MGTTGAAPPAAERVYEHVKGRVLDQTYPPGELLTEGAVAAEVGVSRTPVREALLRLEAEGLLRLYPKRGALVVPVTAREAREVLEARGLIETWAARGAATAGPSLVDELRGLLARMREHADTGDLRGFVAADRAFHESLVNAAGNSILSRLYASLRDRQMCVSARTITVSPERLSSALQDHEAILEAVRAGDVAELEACAAAHLANLSVHELEAS